jgi:hypothetical protein
MHALTPLRAAHLLAAVTAHLVRSCRSVLQHTVDPRRPQVECVAHFIASCICPLDNPLARPCASTACAMQRT